MKNKNAQLYILSEMERNKEKRMQGRDSELTEKGRRDASLLGERLKDIEFKRMISSPGKRTLYTAELVRERIWDPPFIHGTSLTILQIHQDKKEFLLEGCVVHCQ